MKAMTRFLVVSALIVIVGVISAPNAIAQAPAAEASYLSVGEPLDFGGTILEPGRYVIKVLPLFANRNMLQVMSEDQSKVIATALSIQHAIPAGRKMENTEFVYYPAIEGSPRALRTWYASSSTSHGGHDIVYPERRALQLAVVVKEPVIAFKDEVKVEELKTVELEVVTPEKKVIPYVEPTPMPVMVAEVRELPKTAGRDPLFAAIGLLLLGAAIGLRALRVA